MAPPAVQVFVGDEPEMQSERDFLAQLKMDLYSSGVRAFILANFFTRSGARQIDFLVATDMHVCHVELKGYDRALLGSANGPWSSRRADGTVEVIERQNPYHQALACKMALSDDMTTLAARDTAVPRPVGGRKFFTQLDSVVCVFPRLAEGSEVPSDFKVQTLGYRDFFKFLSSPGRNPGWLPEHWEAFVRDLGLANAGEPAAEGMHQSAAISLASEYSRRFDAFHRRGLHEFVPVPLRRDGQAVAHDLLPVIVRSAGHVQLVGPSGCGKSHLLRHSLLGMADSVLPVIVEAGMYEGRLSSLIGRSIARFTTSGVEELLRAAAICARPVLLAVDGLNECPGRLTETLVGDISAFCLRTSAWTMTTAQARMELPADFTGTAVYADALSDADRRAVLASYGAEDIMPFCDPFTTPYELSVAAECASGLHGPVTRGALFSSFVRRQLASTPRPAAVRDTLRQLALDMDGRLATWLSLDEVWRITEEHLARLSAPVGVVDEVLACPLIRKSQGRLSFTHELLGRFLVLEALRRDHSDPLSLARKLRLPRYVGLPQLAAETETATARLSVLMAGLADPRTYAAALRGEAGQLAQRTAEEAGLRLLETVTSGLADTTFTIQSQFEATMTGGYELTEADSALLSAIGELAGDGRHFTEEITALLDAMDAACRRSADMQQRTEGRRPSPSLVVSAMLAPFFTRPPRPRTAASVLLGAARTAWPIGRTRRLSSHPQEDDRVIAGLLDGITPQHHSRLILLCYLLQTKNGLAGAAAVPQVLRMCWESKAYHIMLDSLAMTRSFATAVQGHPLHGEIADILAEIHTDNWALSTMLVEALAAYGLIQSPYDEELVRAQIGQVLSNPTAQESRELAYSIVSNQFEDVIAEPYVAVIDGLTAGQRDMLFTLASLGFPHYGFWNDWLLEHLVESGDPRALPAYERWATRLHSDTPSPQEAARSYALAVRGWAQLAPEPPQLAGAADDTYAAWGNYGAIMFWLHRPGITPAEADRRCAPHWQHLRTGLLHAAADPLYWLDSASQLASEDGAHLTAPMMRAFPDDVRPILEWSIRHPNETESVFKHAGDDRAKTLIRLLAQVGNASSSELLHTYADDAELGPYAIAAIKYLSGGQG
jgi:hypothetical protein